MRRERGYHEPNDLKPIEVREVREAVMRCDEQPALGAHGTDPLLDPGVKLVELLPVFRGVLEVEGRVLTVDSRKPGGYLIDGDLHPDRVEPEVRIVRAVGVVVVAVLVFLMAVLVVFVIVMAFVAVVVVTFVVAFIGMIIVTMTGRAARVGDAEERQARRRAADFPLLLDLHVFEVHA